MAVGAGTNVAAAGHSSTFWAYQRPGTLARWQRFGVIIVGGRSQEGMANWAPQDKRSITHWIGELFRVRSEDVTREHLPERWLDLIQYLNEQERERERVKRTRCARPSH
jgi:hypothetical protein